MKKRKLIERRRALKEAYYNELRKMNVLDHEEVKPLDSYTIKELEEIAEKEGLVLEKKLKKAKLIEAINVFREEKAKAEEEAKALEQEKQELLEVLKDKLELTEDHYNMTNDELKAIIEELDKPATQDAESQENASNGEQDADMQSNDENKEPEAQDVTNDNGEQAEEGKEEDKEPVVTE